MSNATWVVVADSAKARIFQRNNAANTVDELHSMVHPESRLHDGDLRTGGKGREFESTSASSHQTEPQVSPGEKQAADFASEVAGYLHGERARNQYGQLILVAAPGFLGLLRQSLDQSTQNCVIQELDKNYAEQTPEAIYAVINT